MLRNVTSLSKSEISKFVYTLYIHKREITKRGLNMAVADLKQIDSKLKDMYKDQVTVNTSNKEAFKDRSEVLFAQMNFIAMANRQALHLI